MNIINNSINNVSLLTQNKNNVSQSILVDSDTKSKNNCEKTVSSTTDSIEISDASKVEASKNRAMDVFKETCKEMCGSDDPEICKDYTLRTFVTYCEMSSQMNDLGASIADFSPESKNCNFASASNSLQTYMNQILNGSISNFYIDGGNSRIEEFSQFLDVFKEKLTQYGC